MSLGYKFVGSLFLSLTSTRELLFSFFCVGTFLFFSFLCVCQLIFEHTWRIPSVTAVIRTKCFPRIQRPGLHRTTLLGSQRSILIRWDVPSKHCFQISQTTMRHVSMQVLFKICFFSFEQNWSCESVTHLVTWENLYLLALDKYSLTRMGDPT